MALIQIGDHVIIRSVNEEHRIVGEGTVTELSSQPEANMKTVEIAGQRVWLIQRIRTP